MASYGDWVSANIWKARGSLFLAAFFTPGQAIGEDRSGNWRQPKWSRAARTIYSKWRKSAWQNSTTFTYWSILRRKRTVTPELRKIWLPALPSITRVKCPAPQNLNRGKLKLPLHFHPKRKPMRLKHIWKRIAEDLSPTATSENYNPTRWKWVKTSKTAVFYNFYRIRGGLDPLSNPPQTKSWVCKTLYYPFLISANLCPHDRNNFRCSSQLSGIPLQSLSKV